MIDRVCRIALLSIILGAALACGGGGEETGGADDPSPAPSTLPIPGSEEAGATGGNLPEGHPPLAGDQSLPPVQGVGGLAWDTPADWVAETPSTSMRQAEYRIPGPAGDGSCAVFYFGAGQGGDTRANILRWAGEFTQADGRDSTEVMTTEEFQVGQVEVTTVEVTGTFSGGMTMSTAPPEPLSDAMLLGAVAQGPDAPWFFKCTGPEPTMRANREAFVEMLRSLRTTG